MVLNWFDTKEIDKFADAISADFLARFPPSEIEAQKRKGAARFKKARDAVFAQTEDFVRAKSLNMYKKARLGNRFKWALKEAGYPDKFIDSLTYELTAFVAVKAGMDRKAASR